MGGLRFTMRLMVQTKVAETPGLRPSVTLTVLLNVPVAVGVPVMMPVLVLILSPVGKALAL